MAGGTESLRKDIEMILEFGKNKAFGNLQNNFRGVITEAKLGQMENTI